MHSLRWIPVMSLLLVGCAGTGREPGSARKAEAERFLRALYGGDTTVVNALAADTIVVSYPIFQEVLGTPAVRGIDAVRAFSIRFSHKWEQQQVTVHQAIAEGDRVVLVWSVRAHLAQSDASAQAPAEADQAWGGITVYQFDADGRIAVEFGEESTPGPYARLSR